MKQVKKEEKVQWFEFGYPKKASSSQFIPRLVLDDREKALVSFLTTEPMGVFRHFIGGRYHTCRVRNCYFCEIGNQPTWRGLFLVYDMKDKEVKILEVSRTVAQVIAELECDFSKNLVQIKRIGTGAETQYTFTPIKGKVVKLSPEELKAYQDRLISQYEPDSYEDQKAVLKESSKTEEEE
jgi:hypothetical protein